MISSDGFPPPTNGREPPWQPPSQVARAAIMAEPPMARRTPRRDTRRASSLFTCDPYPLVNAVLHADRRPSVPAVKGILRRPRVLSIRAPAIPGPLHGRDDQG